MKVLAFGETLWDIINGQAHIGGAPFNLAAHLARMGVATLLVSAVGDDRLGKDALRQAAAVGIDTGLIGRNAKLPTGTVEVKLNAQGVPDFTIAEQVAWDEITLTNAQIEALAADRIDAVCFGTLAQRSPSNRETLRALLTRLHPGQVFYDVNLRRSYYAGQWIKDSLAASTILKCNEDEVRILGHVLFSAELDQTGFAKRVGAEYPVAAVCITRGAQGAAVYQDGVLHEVPGLPVTVADTVGAGDAFSAGFLFAYLKGRDVKTAAGFANQLGTFVASQAGAVPEYPEAIKQALERI